MPRITYFRDLQSRAYSLGLYEFLEERNYRTRLLASVDEGSGWSALALFRREQLYPRHVHPHTQYAAGASCIWEVGDARAETEVVFTNRVPDLISGAFTLEVFCNEVPGPTTTGLLLSARYPNGTFLPPPAYSVSCKTEASFLRLSIQEDVLCSAPLPSSDCSLFELEYRLRRKWHYSPLIRGFDAPSSLLEPVGIEKAIVAMDQSDVGRLLPGVYNTTAAACGSVLQGVYEFQGVMFPDQVILDCMNERGKLLREGFANAP